jgi:hypothetical protein
MSWSTARRSTAIVTIFGLLTMATSGVLLAGQPSTLTGRVVAQNNAEPRSGVVVTLVETASEKAYRSSPTDARGAFTIDAAPAGSYALVVEAPEGAFLASNQLQLAPGVNRPVSLALKSGKADEPPAAGSTPPPAPKSGTPTWAKWVIAGAVIVGAAVVVDAVTSDSNEASSF